MQVLTLTSQGFLDMRWASESYTKSDDPSCLMVILETLHITRTSSKAVRLSLAELNKQKHVWNGTRMHIN